VGAAVDAYAPPHLDETPWDRARLVKLPKAELIDLIVDLQGELHRRLQEKDRRIAELTQQLAQRQGEIALAKAAQKRKDIKLRLSSAGISKIMIRLSNILQPVYAEILNDVKQGAKIWADETGWRVKGKLWWLWIFANARSAYYWADASRGGGVVQVILGEVFFGLLIVDGWHACTKIVCDRQTCMAHIFRKIRAFIDAFPQYRSIMTFYLKLQRIIRDGEKLQSQRGELAEIVFRRRLKRLEKRLDALLAWQNPNEMLKEVIKKVERQKDHIPTFISYVDAPHHNNYGEFIIKKGVVKRKMSGGSMSVEGARAYACIQSIAMTCQLRRISFHRFLKASLVRYIRTGQPMSLAEYEVGLNSEATAA
jgi:transposase